MARNEPGRDARVSDVALRAGVSKTQAASALGAYDAVSDSVRTAVLAAAEELGYRPNQLAKSMTTGRPQTLGVVVGDIENPYFGLVVRGISDTARSRSYNVMLLNTDEQLRAEQDAAEPADGVRRIGQPDRTEPADVPARPPAAHSGGRFVRDVRRLPWTTPTTPPLTVIGQSVYEMGVEAARRVLDRIEGRDPGAKPTLSAAVVDGVSIGAPPAPSFLSATAT